MSEKTEKKDKPEKPDVKVALATFKERFMAGLIDYGIIIGSFIIGTIILSILSWVSWGLIEILFWFLGSILEIVALAAFVFLMIWLPFKKDGQSLGKKNQNIKVMVIEDEEKWIIRPIGENDIGPVIVRAIVGWIEVVIVPVVIAWHFITNDKNSQRIADQIAKTVVVQVDPETSAPLKKPRIKETKE